jgi:hypothetical protein
MISLLELYWIPLGAGDGIGARVARFSGGTYERLELTVPLTLLHDPAGRAR